MSISDSPAIIVKPHTRTGLSTLMSFAEVMNEPEPSWADGTTFGSRRPRPWEPINMNTVDRDAHEPDTCDFYCSDVRWATGRAFAW